MRFRLTPQDEGFLELFAATGAILVEACHVLTEAIGSDPHRRAELSDAMQEIEHRGDESAHAIVRKVNSSYLTPFDREDVYLLSTRLDDCLDLMQKAVDRMVVYRVGKLPEAVGELLQVLSRQAELTAEAMPRLRTLSALSDYWVEINRLENQADQIHLRLLGEIFDGGFDAVEIIKHKEIVDTLEDAADAFERIAQTVETIVVKGS